MNEPKHAVETAMVLAKPGSTQATLFCVVNGKSRWEPISRKALLALARSALEAIENMEPPPS